MNLCKYGPQPNNSRSFWALPDAWPNPRMVEAILLLLEGSTDWNRLRKIGGQGQGGRRRQRGQGVGRRPSRQTSKPSRSTCPKAPIYERLTQSGCSKRWPTTSLTAGSSVVALYSGFGRRDGRLR